VCGVGVGWGGGGGGGGGALRQRVVKDSESEINSGVLAVQDAKAVLQRRSQQLTQELHQAHAAYVSPHASA
jgi:hypothetical protein